MGQKTYVRPACRNAKPTSENIRIMWVGSAWYTQRQQGEQHLSIREVIDPCAGVAVR
jgi:hypothetical protein